MTSHSNSSNSTNSTEPQSSRKILNTIYITVATIGIIANTFVLCVVKRNRSMHTAVNFLLVNVARSDILQLAGSFIYSAMDLKQNFKSHINGVFCCKILLQVIGFAVCSSVFNSNFVVAAALQWPRHPNERKTAN